VTSDIMKPKIKFNGRWVLLSDFAELKRLFPVALGATDARLPKRKAEAIALDAAIDALATIRRRIRYAEALAWRAARRPAKTDGLL